MRRLPLAAANCAHAVTPSHENTRRHISGAAGGAVRGGGVAARAAAAAAELPRRPRDRLPADDGLPAAEAVPARRRGGAARVRRGLHGGEPGAMPGRRRRRGGVGERCGCDDGAWVCGLRASKKP
eukprot:4752737-Prymnesium_polylepis.1